MSTNLFAIFAVVIFTVSLWRSAVYGETTSKPLGVVFVVPAFASDVILCLMSGAHSSSDFIVVIGPCTMIALMFGLFCYQVANKSRKK